MTGEESRPTTRRDGEGNPEGAGSDPLAGDPYAHLRRREEERKRKAQERADEAQEAAGGEE